MKHHHTSSATQLKQQHSATRREQPETCPANHAHLPSIRAGHDVCDIVCVCMCAQKTIAVPYPHCASLSLPICTQRTCSPFEHAGKKLQGEPSMAYMASTKNRGRRQGTSPPPGNQHEAQDLTGQEQEAQQQQQQKDRTRRRVVRNRPPAECKRHERLTPLLLAPTTSSNMRLHAHAGGWTHAPGGPGRSRPAQAQCMHRPPRRPQQSAETTLVPNKKRAPWCAGGKCPSMAQHHHSSMGYYRLELNKPPSSGFRFAFWLPAAQTSLPSRSMTTTATLSVV